MTLAAFWALILLTLREPRAAAGQVVRLLPDTQSRILALGAVAAASGALGVAGEQLFAFVTKIDLGPSSNAVPLALFQAGLMVYVAFAMTVFGRQFGGQGRFGDAFTLVLWIEAIMVVGNIAQLVVMVFFPLIATLATLALFALMVWLLVQFTAALHGFTNLFAVGAGVVAVFFGSAMVLGALMLALGITPPFMAAN